MKYTPEGKALLELQVRLIEGNHTPDDLHLVAVLVGRILEREDVRDTYTERPKRGRPTEDAGFWAAVHAEALKSVTGRDDMETVLREWPTVTEDQLRRDRKASRFGKEIRELLGKLGDAELLKLAVMHAARERQRK